MFRSHTNSSRPGRYQHLVVSRPTQWHAGHACDLNKVTWIFRIPQHRHAGRRAGHQVQDTAAGYRGEECPINGRVVDRFTRSILGILLASSGPRWTCLRQKACRCSTSRQGHQPQRCQRGYGHPARRRSHPSSGSQHRRPTFLPPLRSPFSNGRTKSVFRLRRDSAAGCHSLYLPRPRADRQVRMRGSPLNRDADL